MHPKCTYMFCVYTKCTYILSVHQCIYILHSVYMTFECTHTLCMQTCLECSAYTVHIHVWNEHTQCIHVKSVHTQCTYMCGAYIHSVHTSRWGSLMRIFCHTPQRLSHVHLATQLQMLFILKAHISKHSQYKEMIKQCNIFHAKLKIF